MIISGKSLHKTNAAAPGSGHRFNIAGVIMSVIGAGGPNNTTNNGRFMAEQAKREGMMSAAAQIENVVEQLNASINDIAEQVESTGGALDHEVPYAFTSNLHPFRFTSAARGEHGLRSSCLW